MHVFITGGSGWVGSAVTNQLIAAGHRVSGLARSDAAAAKLAEAGAAVVRGDLSDLDVLAAGGRAADAVIHCGFIHDFSNYAAAAEVDRHALETFGDALAGSGKTLIATTGLGVQRSGPLATEDDWAETRHVPRVSEQTTLAQTDRDVSAMVVRLPTSVHGNGDHGFVPTLIKVARERGTSGYVEAGDNRWPSVHRDDAARLYVLALEKGVAGARYHAVHDEGVPFRDIAAAIGRGANVPTISVPGDRAQEHFGWIGRFAGADLPSSSALTRQRLGWGPTGSTLIENLDRGTYFSAR